MSDKTTDDFEVVRCQRRLMAAGLPYAKSCEICRLGPCREDAEAMTAHRKEVVGRWTEAQRKVFVAEDALKAAVAERDRAAAVCEAAGVNPWGAEVPRHDR